MADGTSPDGEPLLVVDGVGAGVGETGDDHQRRPRGPANCSQPKHARPLDRDGNRRLMADPAGTSKASFAKCCGDCASATSGSPAGAPPRQAGRDARPTSHPGSLAIADRVVSLAAIERPAHRNPPVVPGGAPWSRLRCATSCGSAGSNWSTRRVLAARHGIAAASGTGWSRAAVDPQRPVVARPSRWNGVASRFHGGDAGRESLQAMRRQYQRAKTAGRAADRRTAAALCLANRHARRAGGLGGDAAACRRPCRHRGQPARGDPAASARR